MKRVFLVKLLIAFFVPLIFQAVTLLAQDDTACPYSQAAYYNPDLSAMMTEAGFSLVNHIDNTLIVTLDSAVLSTIPGDGYDIHVGYTLRWGENCRYIYLINHYRATESSTLRHTAIYDTQTMSRIALFTGVETNFRLTYSSDKQHVYIESASGNYLLSDNWTQAVFLAPYQAPLHHSEGGVSQALRVSWDLNKRLFYMVFREDNSHFYAYNIDTGALQFTISNPQACYTPLSFQIVNDNQYALIYSKNRIRGIRTTTVPACVTIVHIDSRAQSIVDAGIIAFYEEDQIALSPDAHYLVSGMKALRVWDLATYVEGTHLEPIFRHEGPMSIIGSVKFIDNDTLLTTSDDGTQEWNILSGLLES